MTHRYLMHRLLRLALVVLPLCFASACHGQQPNQTTRAARLTFLQGSVTLDRNDNSASEPAQLNLPILAGARIATGGDGQAEVEFEDGSLIRLTPNTAVSFDNLSVDSDGSAGIFTTNLSVLRGLAYAELRATRQYSYTVDAGGDVISPVENTTVRINLDEPPAAIAVLDGKAHIERRTGPNDAGYTTDLIAGETLRADANDPIRYFLTQEIAEDSWDQWNEARDQAASAAAGMRTTARDGYAGAQGYGWSDLDANGKWYQVPGQGPVWQPDIAAGPDGSPDASFDPYGSGAWVYYPTSGYLWASSYAWGWTPYRCGNWSYFNSFGWGWAPGGACGGAGWGFGGVNILNPPRFYRNLPVPVPGPGRVHPILTVHRQAGPRPQSGLGSETFAGGQAGGSSLSGGGSGGSVAYLQPGTRRIAGQYVEALGPIGGGYTPRGGTATGMALQRDFPVDPNTHTALIGIPSTQPGLAFTGSGWRSSGVRPSVAYPAPVYRGSAGTVAPAYRGPGPNPGYRAPGGGTTSHPALSTAPPPGGPRPTAPSAPASHPAPRPSYSPPAPRAAPAAHSAPSPKR